MATIFTKIAKGEIPSYKVAENEEYYAFLDIAPMAKGHTLVIPKAHAADIMEIGEADLSELVVRVKRIAAHLKDALGCDGFHVLQNNGAAAGQTVRHIHFHIVPRWNGDPIVFENHEGDMDELAALAAKIRM